jgi:hypothetical protein
MLAIAPGATTSSWVADRVRSHQPIVSLRDYQDEAVDAVATRTAEGKQRLMVVLPTGAGKTVVFGALAWSWLADGMGRVLVLAHRDELIAQAVAKMSLWIPRHLIGIVKAARNEVDAPVVVASVQTLRNDRRLEQVGQFGLVVVDEAHHASGRFLQEDPDRARCVSWRWPDRRRGDRDAEAWRWRPARRRLRGDRLRAHLLRDGREGVPGAGRLEGVRPDRAHGHQAEARDRRRLCRGLARRGDAQGERARQDPGRLETRGAGSADHRLHPDGQRGQGGGRDIRRGRGAVGLGLRIDADSRIAARPSKGLHRVGSGWWRTARC